MADFKVPNLCGASVNMNAIQSKFETLMKSAIDGLEVDASALKSTLDSEVTAVVGDIKKIVPELPALPDVNLQGQLTSLSGMTVGSGAHNTLLADITSKFGSALTAGGFSLDTLVSDAASAISGGTNLCSAVPNFTVPAAGGDAVQKAVAVLQPEVDALPEKLSTLVENDNFTALKSAAETAIKKFQAEVSEAPDLVPFTITGTEPPTADIGALTVASAFKDVTFPGGIKLPLTLNKDDPKNVSEKGFARCSYTLSEEFKSTGTLTLKRKPYRIESVQGYSTEYKDINSIQRGKPERWVAGKKPVYIEALKQVDQGDFSEFIDLWSVDGNTITIHSTEYKWDGHPDTGVIFRISYSYFDTFEPDRVVLDA